MLGSRVAFRSRDEHAAKGDRVTAMDYSSAAGSFFDCPEKEWILRALEFSQQALEMEPGVQAALGHMRFLQSLGRHEEMVRVGEQVLREPGAQDVHPDYVYCLEAMLLEAKFATHDPI